MPTNNQEKWEERFEEQFHYLRQIFHDGLSGKESEEEEIKSIKSFLRQEIRQAKIETWEKAKKLNEEKSVYRSNYLGKLIDEAISNLKKQ